MGVNSRMPADWTSKPPSAHDIVATYFPEKKPKGAVRLRPCLVLDVYEAESDAPGGISEYAVRLAFGTKNIKAHRSSVDLIVQNIADLEAIGLPYPTRFDLDDEQIAFLAWNEKNFGCWSGFPSPVIGFLDDKYIERLERKFKKHGR